MAAVRLPIRQLVEFLLRTGSIDSRFTGFDRANEGARIHRKLQKAAGEGYQAEVALRADYAAGGVDFVLEGRADGIFTDETGTTVIDEIKTTAVPFEEITEDALFEKVRQIFAYSLHDETICRLRKMLTLEQFRSPELAALYSHRYVERLVAYHAAIFRDLIAAGCIQDGDPEALALLYVAPINALIGICDRQPDREEECLQKLRDHVHAFFRLVHLPCGAQSAKLPENSEKEGLTL